MIESNDKVLGVVHAALITTRIIQPYLDEILPDVQVMHHLDDTIQCTNFACEPGTIPKENYYKFATHAHFLENAGVDLIMLACSTFNRAVELAQPMINTPLLQIDRPMMDLAVKQGSKIGLLATVPTTVPSSERLLRKAAADAGKDVTITTRLCAEAFAAIQAGDTDKHNELLIKEVDVLSRDMDAIVMAQLSMSALAPLLRNTKVPVYTSGETGCLKAKEILDSLQE